LSDNEFDEKMVTGNLIKAIEDGIKTVDAILGTQNFTEDAYTVTG
jgi:hypothetical protein